MKGSDLSIKVRRWFSVSPGRVFDAWLDPSRARKFLFATETGEMVRCEIDARVGGRFCLVDRRDGEDVEHVGEYLEIDRPRRLVFSFAVPKFSPTYTTVTVEVRPVEEGSEVVLTHVLPAEVAEWEEQDRKGWTMILEALERAV